MSEPPGRAAVKLATDPSLLQELFQDIYQALADTSIAEVRSCGL